MCPLDPTSTPHPSSFSLSHPIRPHLPSPPTVPPLPSPSFCPNDLPVSLPLLLLLLLLLVFLSLLQTALSASTPYSLPLISSLVIPRSLQSLVASSPSVSSEGGYCFLRIRLLLRQLLIHSPPPIALRAAVMNVAYRLSRHPEHHGSTRNRAQVYHRFHPTG